MNGRLRYRIMRLGKSFIRDRWGNLTNCYWNQMIKDDILKLEEQIVENSVTFKGLNTYK